MVVLVPGFLAAEMSLFLSFFLSFFLSLMEGDNAFPHLGNVNLPFHSERASERPTLMFKAHLPSFRSHAFQIGY